MISRVAQAVCHTVPTLNATPAIVSSGGAIHAAMPRGRPAASLQRWAAHRGRCCASRKTPLLHPDFTGELRAIPRLSLAARWKRAKALVDTLLQSALCLAAFSQGTVMNTLFFLRSEDFGLLRTIVRRVLVAGEGFHGASGSARST